MGTLEEAIKGLSVNIAELIKQIKINTEQMIKLKKEVRKQRRVEEKNIKFLQDLITQMFHGQQETKEKTINIIGKIANWVIKVAILVGLAYLGIQPFIP